jgi:transcriptional regulator with XRE-family HTH domain
MANENERATWFAARLKELREAAGLTQKELADRAKVSQRAVSHWEQGLREPGWAAVLTLAEVLGVDCTAFTQAPAERPEQGPGRPRKAAAEGEGEPAAEEPSEPAKGKGRKKGK